MPAEAPQTLHLHPTAAKRPSAPVASACDTPERWPVTAGANSIFYGEKLLTTGNPDVPADRALLERLGMATGQV